jgi:hypothetical protein
MALFIRKDSGSNGKRTAPEGLYDAVCCDVIDLGIVTTAYGEKQQIQILWELVGEDGAVYTLSKRYSASLHEKSKLFQDLRSWRGQDWSAEEMSKGIDLETLVGKCCQILVVHIDKEGTQYAVVDKILKGKKKIALSGNYNKDEARLRILDRVTAQQHQHNSSQIREQFRSVAPKPAAAPIEPEKDELPF